MALIKRKVSEIPRDAIVLSEAEALKYQIKIMNSWKIKSDTLAYRHGGALLACMSTIAGIYINSHYRLQFKLFAYARVSSYLPICIMPAALSLLLHTEFVLSNVLLQKSCAVCMELRASAIQAISGCLVPAILAPLSAIPAAIQYNTYDVPYITKEPMKVIRLWQKQTKPIANMMFAIFLGQALLASAVTYFESRSVQNVNSKLAKLEYELEHSGINP